MLMTLIILVALSGGAWFYINQRYIEVKQCIQTVEQARKDLNQSLNERHQAINQILQYAKAHEVRDEPIKHLALLRRKVKEAHEAQEDADKVQAEVLISEHSELILEAIQQYSELEEAAQQYQQAMSSLLPRIKAYHSCVEAYDELVEQFVQSVLIAVFEKELFRKHPVFEHIDEDDHELTDNFM